MDLEWAQCKGLFFGDGSTGNLMQADASAAKEKIFAQEGSAQVIYMDPPFFTGQRFYYRPRQDKRDEFVLYEDRWNSMEDYLRFLEASLYNAKYFLKENGLLFLHIDYRVAAECKILLDQIFGKKHFINEIIWNYRSGGSSSRHFARKHDTILLYSKTAQYYFNLKAVGVPRGKEKRNHLKRNVDENGRVYYSIQSGGKLYKYYEDGLIYPSDVWNDIPHLHQRDPERTGYDTQKPEQLLKRILLASSRKGDLVADFFSGSGTTAAVAAKHGRRFLAVDFNRYAMEVGMIRLLKAGCANMAVCLETTENRPELQLYLEREKEGYRIQLTGYAAQGKAQTPLEKQEQMAFNEMPRGKKIMTAQGEHAESTDTVMFFGAGSLIADQFYPARWSLRTKDGLESVLHVPAQKGKIAVGICDIFSNFHVFCLNVD